MLPVKYTMNNRVNGKDIVISGAGHVSTAGLELDLTVDHVPENWSGIIVPCICSGPGPDPRPDPTETRPRSTGPRVRTPGLMSLSPGGYTTTPGTIRRASIFDQNGEAVAAVKATGKYLKSKEGMDFAIEVDTQTVPDSVVSRLTSVDSYGFSVHAIASGQVEVVSSYQLSTDDGELAHGWTHIYYNMLGYDSVLPATLVGRNHIDVQWNDTSLKYKTVQSNVTSLSLGSL